jgi:hypothetical protein
MRIQTTQEMNGMLMESLRQEARLAIGELRISGFSKPEMP